MWSWSLNNAEVLAHPGLLHREGKSLLVLLRILRNSSYDFILSVGSCVTCLCWWVGGSVEVLSVQLATRCRNCHCPVDILRDFFILCLTVVESSPLYSVSPSASQGNVISVVTVYSFSLYSILRFSRQWLWWLLSSTMWRRLVWYEQTTVLIPCLPHNYPLLIIDVYLPYLFDAVHLKRRLLRFDVWIRNLRNEVIKRVRWSVCAVPWGKPLQITGARLYCTLGSISVCRLYKLILRPSPSRSDTDSHSVWCSVKIFSRSARAGVGGNFSHQEPNHFRRPCLCVPVACCVVLVTLWDTHAYTCAWKIMEWTQYSLSEPSC